MLRVALENFLKQLAAALPGGKLSAEVPMVDFNESVRLLTETPRLRVRIERRLSDARESLGRLRQKVLDFLLPSSTSPVRRMVGAQRRDRLLSIIAALGAVLAYVLPVYGETWGTPTDYLTAIAAGFGAQAVVRWGALPIFQSWGKDAAPSRPVS